MSPSLPSPSGRPAPDPAPAAKRAPSADRAAARAPLPGRAAERLAAAADRQQEPSELGAEPGRDTDPARGADPGRDTYPARGADPGRGAGAGRRCPPGLESGGDRGPRSSRGLPFRRVRPRAPDEAPADELDTCELLARLLDPRRAAAGSGARLLLERSDLLELSRSPPGELRRLFDLAPREAARVAAAFALGRRAARHTREHRPSLRSAALVHALLAPELCGLERETFHVLLLDGKHALRRRELVSVGTLTTSLVHPREVFRPAVRESAAAIICAHNHPSGDPEPSPEDIEVTRRLHQAGRLLGIPLLDHVVIGQGRYVSLRERLRL